MTTRREALQLGALGAAGLAGVQGGTDSGSGGAASPLAPENRPVPYRGVFRRPPELLPYATTFDDGDPARPVDHYAVTERLGRMEVLPGLSTPVAGYNGIFPGPTIRARRGTRIELRMRNGFPEAPGLLLPQRTDTSTHLHGSPSLPQYDGYANDLTVPGYVKTYKYPNTEKASTLWYHDHRHLVTAQNVYSGLAAFYPYSDQYERAQLPQGEYDVPLMISDAQFNADGSLRYDLDGDAGLWGDIILVNGVPWPTMKVKPRIYRFRVLVASISRSYRPTLSNGDPVHVVGTDGGMVPVVQPVRSWRQGTGERVEVLVDFRGFRAGQTVDLRNLSNKNNVDFADTDKIMRFQVVADSGPGIHRHRHPDDPGRGPAAQRGPGRHLDDGPDPGDGRREAPAAVRAPARGVDGERGHLGGRGGERVHPAVRQPEAVQRRAVDDGQRVGRLVPPRPHPPGQRQDHRPEHQRRQAVCLGAGAEGRLLPGRERVGHRADAVRHRSPTGRGST